MSPPGGVPAEGVVLQHGGETLRLRGFYPQAGEGGQAVQDTCHMLSLHTCHVSPELAGICPRVQGSQELHQGPGLAGGGQQVQPEHHQPGGGGAPGQVYCCLLSTTKYLLSIHTWAVAASSPARTPAVCGAGACRPRCRTPASSGDSPGQPPAGAHLIMVYTYTYTSTWARW